MSYFQRHILDFFTVKRHCILITEVPRVHNSRGVIRAVRSRLYHLYSIKNKRLTMPLRTDIVSFWFRGYRGVIFTAPSYELVIPVYEAGVAVCIRTELQAPVIYGCDSCPFSHREAAIENEINNQRTRIKNR